MQLSFNAYTSQTRFSFLYGNIVSSSCTVDINWSCTGHFWTNIAPVNVTVSQLFVRLDYIMLFLAFLLVATRSVWSTHVTQLENPPLKQGCVVDAPHLDIVSLDICGNIIPVSIKNSETVAFRL